MLRKAPPVPNTEYNGINGSPTAASRRKKRVVVPTQAPAFKNGGKVTRKKK